MRFFAHLTTAFLYPAAALANGLCEVHLLDPNPQMELTWQTICDDQITRALPDGLRVTEAEFWDRRLRIELAPTPENAEKLRDKFVGGSKDDAIDGSADVDKILVEQATALVLELCRSNSFSELRAVVNEPTWYVAAVDMDCDDEDSLMVIAPGQAR